MPHSSGVVGIYADPESLMAGGAALRSAHYKHLDAFTPFPVHGIDKALGIGRSWLSAVTLVLGILGCLAGFALQVWTSAYDWPINVGGKPMASIPAFIPVIFECTILFGGVATFFAALFFCGLPGSKSGIVDPRVTDHSFALWVPMRTTEQASKVEAIMKEHGATEVRIVEAEPRQAGMVDQILAKPWVAKLRAHVAAIVGGQ